MEILPLYLHHCDILFLWEHKQLPHIITPSCHDLHHAIIGTGGMLPISKLFIIGDIDWEQTGILPAHEQQIADCEDALHIGLCLKFVFEL